jgi:hypothetical protein
MESHAGRTCPIEYAYTPQSFTRLPDLYADTIYIIGGLYGNLDALDAIVEMQRREEADGGRVTLFFNGDFNWFNLDSAEFDAINRAVFVHRAIIGNVEAELSAERLSQVGCGCGYPEYIGEDVVERSNAIIARLKETAAQKSEIAEELSRLPLNAVVSVGDERVAVVHGDARSLAGWEFAAEVLEPPNIRLRRSLSVPETLLTRCVEMEAYFRIAGVRIFASTHTGLPVAQTYEVDSRRCLLINNGCAGMPNFKGERCGVITRISADSRPPKQSLYGCKIGRLRCDALAVRYDHDSFMRRFLTNWPKGSPAYESYYWRLMEGPDYTLQEAVREGLVANRS